MQRPETARAAPAIAGSGPQINERFGRQLGKHNTTACKRKKAAPKKRRIDFDGINRAALASLPAVLARVLPSGKQVADAAADVFPKSVCVTSPGGSQTADKADWTPLAGRRVLIWPDADEAGLKYASQVAAILRGQSCEISIIDAVALARLAPEGGQSEPEKGWDAADAVVEWQDLKALRKAAVDLAKPYEPGPQFVSWGGFTMDAGELTVEVERGKGENKTTETIWVAAPFEVLGACRDPQGNSWERGGR
jgi:putative DNA primase/helicase